VDSNIENQRVIKLEILEIREIERDQYTHELNCKGNLKLGAGHGN
jgi:hypothetical protein